MVRSVLSIIVLFMIPLAVVMVLRRLIRAICNLLYVYPYDMDLLIQHLLGKIQDLDKQHGIEQVQYNNADRDPYTNKPTAYFQHYKQRQHILNIKKKELENVLEFARVCKKNPGRTLRELEDVLQGNPLPE